MKIGKAIKRFCGLAGMRQQDLAAILDVAETTVSQWETGRRYPTIPNLCRIADALSVDVADIVLLAEQLTRKANS